MSKSSREERRRAELAKQRARRRGGTIASTGRSPLVAISLGALALGVVGVIAFAIVSAPPAPAELREPTQRAPVELADGLALGVADAPVTVEIWSDFQCPACRALVEQIEPVLIDGYVESGEVRMVYRDFPFLGPESVNASIAARCAARSGQFWPFHDYLFANQSGENQGAFSQARLEAIASAVALDLATFRSCQADPAIAEAVEAERAAGQALAINSTPTLLVNGRAIVGVPPMAELRAAIEQALAEAVAP